MTTKDTPKDLSFRIWLRSDGIIGFVGISVVTSPGTLPYSLYQQIKELKRVDNLLAVATSYLFAAASVHTNLIQPVNLRILELTGDDRCPLLILRLDRPRFTPLLTHSDRGLCKIYLTGLVEQGVISHA